MKIYGTKYNNLMLQNNDPLLPKLKVNDANRERQVLERNPLAVEVFTEEVFLRKWITYITTHFNRNDNFAKTGGLFL